MMEEGEKKQGEGNKRIHIKDDDHKSRGGKHIGGESEREGRGKFTGGSIGGFR